MDDPIHELIELDAVNEADNTGRTALFYALSTLAVQTLVKAGANINIADNQGKTPLIHALLYNKNSDVVRALIDAGADVNIADEEGKTALLYAVQQRNNESVVRALIAAGVDVNITDREGKTALFHSVISDNESTAMLLINAYADVNKDENSGKTALFYAVSKSMVHTLIAAGADTNKVDKNGKSILLHAVMKHKENLALAMIEAGAYVNFIDEDNDSILFYSVMQNSEVLINALVKAGADINKTDQEGKTPLYFALMYRKENASRTLIQALAREGFEEERTTALFNASSKEEIQALVESGIDINSTNHKGQSPLHKAIQCKKRKVACSLIQAGAEVNLVAECGATPLFQACLTNSSELVKVLVDAGADVNKTDLSGKNSLYYIKDNLSIANSIISAGVEVNAKDNNGKTALFYAIRYNTAHVATAMIDAGADVKMCDDNDESLLNFAVINRNESLVRALLKGGANANFIPNAGNPALFYAVLWDNDNIVKMLLKSGADVNVVLDEGKTILFFALENAAMVKTLIEDGGAHVNVKDTYGRTPLFYAITKSISTSTYLFEKGAKFQARDNCNLSILSSYVESTMSEYQYNIQKVLDGEGADLLLKHGVERGDVFDAIIDVVFRKLLYISSLNMPFFNYEDGLDAAQLARNANKVAENTKPPKENLIDNILSLICREVTNIKSFYEIQIPKIIPQLIELGANPNSADSDGNTALHYLTRLPFLGVSKDVIMEIYSQLKTFGVLINATNRQLETPLLFCLSGAISKVKNKQHELSGIKMLVDICTWLLEDGANIQRTMRTGESVFHLVMELFRHGLVQDESIREGVIGEAMKLLALFSGKCKTKKDKGITVNRRDINLNAPLHLWASLSLETVNEYHDSLLLKEKIVFKDFLKLILNYLLSCGAKLNDRNAMEQTPLHLCRTWAAVELLNDAGANPIVLDSLGRSPLLVALEKRTFAYSENSFYPDVLQDPYAFWVAALECNLDLWAVGRNGDTVMSGLIHYNNFVLAKALLDVADEKNYLHSDSLAMDILNGICKVRNTMNASWKSTLVEMILRSKKSFIVSKRNEETPLHFCSRNIVRNYAISRATYSTSDHWTIAKQLLWYGADPTVPDSNGQSCLDIAESCPVLKELLMKPMSIDEVPMLIPWLSVSEKYQPILAKTSRRQECEHVDSFWYHKTHLESGTFGLIFAGINEKDGREVAIKRIEKRRMGRREDKREIENLLALADCEQVVRYLHFFENENFSYVVLELMEGNLDEYLSSYLLLDNLTSTQLCKHVVMGLKFLHGRNILHRDLKPTNILYKLSPNLSLKIADFGLSRRIDSTSSTVYGTNMGTRCWIAPEILTDTEGHSKSSDIFSCGLILHYILSVRRHPFAPSDCTNKSLLQIQNETEANVIKGELEGWDFSLSPECSNLVGSMLSKDKEKRLSGAEALAHPFFWSKKKKIDLLIAVGNQPEFSCPRAKVTYTLTAVENDLEASFGTIVKHVKWTDPGYVHMPAIYTEMTKGRKTPYDPFSVVELERFIRNAYAHVSESKRPTPIRKQLLEDFVFLEYFPNLVMEVYKAVNTHGWDQTREEIKYALKK